MRVFITVSLIAIAALLTAATNQAESRIGFVDLNQLFEGYNRKGELEAELAGVKADIESKLKQVEAELTELQNEMQLLEKNSSRYEELEDKSAVLTQKRTRLQRRSAEEFQRRKAAFHEQLLAAIERTIAEYAQENRYTAVFQREFTLGAEARSWKSVLFHAPESDLTAAILERLNQG